ncbi:MAG: apolipoprotein N-acyltransferase [Planctomycetaceae bacterium]|jgi:apolipoprotein N-acyltransferase|nr:apolipoprotein N-acyltransferase [Planctomycetaceae bacterium]
MKNILVNGNNTNLFSIVNVLFLAGLLCYWVSLPPLGCWYFVFFVPVFWTFVIEHPKPIRFRIIYLGAFLFWIASIWWIACPHPLTSLGLLALAGYLSMYWVLFFSASRIAVFCFRIPVVLAIPVCWIGCEYLRNHLLGGFSFCSLEHALYRQPLLIQIADIGGGYFVGGMVMLIGSGIALGVGSLWTRQVNRLVWSLVAGLIFVAALGYGFVQTAKTVESRNSQSNLTIAVLQGNIPVRLNGGSAQTEKTFQQFIDLTNNAVRNAQATKQPLDLIVLPETVCSIPLLQYNADVKPTEFEDWTEGSIEYWEEQFELFRIFVRKLGVPVLAGLSTLEFVNPPEPTRLNSALLIDPNSDNKNDGDSNNNATNTTEYRYDKIQLVMFGEYIPFSQYLPKNFFLKTLCQEAGRGTKMVAIPLNGEQLFLSVNICFESTIPHFIRNQVLTLKKQGKEPAILVNMSNDGWFWFSQQIDQHLATHVFRAIENRRPYITATNGGFSAIIDSCGVIQNIGQRRKAEIVVGSISATDYQSPIYHDLGDCPAIACMFGVFVMIFAGWYKNRNKPDKTF